MRKNERTFVIVTGAILAICFVILTILDIRELDRNAKSVEAGPMNVEVPSADAEPDYCGDMTRRVCQVGEAMMCDCPGGGQSAQFCNTTCSAWMPCKCHIDSKNREVQPKGSSLMMGDRCDCRLNGRPIVTNDGPGYCIDGVAVDERSYEKLSKDPKFVYTKCPDPRKDGGK